MKEIRCTKKVFLTRRFFVASFDALVEPDLDGSAKPGTMKPSEARMQRRILKSEWRHDDAIHDDGETRGTFEPSTEGTDGRDTKAFGRGGEKQEHGAGWRAGADGGGHASATLQGKSNGDRRAVQRGQGSRGRLRDL